MSASKQGRAWIQIHRLDFLWAILSLGLLFSLFHVHEVWSGLSGWTGLSNDRLDQSTRKVQDFLSQLEYQTFDYRSQFKEQQRPTRVDPELVMLAIDDTALERYGKWPWPRSYWVKILRSLQVLGVDGIYFDVEFQDTSDPTLSKDSSGTSIYDALRTGRRVLIGDLDPAKGIRSSVLEILRTGEIDKGVDGLFTFLGDRIEQVFQTLRANLDESINLPDEALARAIIEADRNGCPTFGISIFREISKDPGERRKYHTGLAILKSLTVSDEVALSDPVFRRLEPAEVETLKTQFRLARHLVKDFAALPQDLARRLGVSDEFVRDHIIRIQELLMVHAVRQTLQTSPRGSEMPDDAVIRKALESLNTRAPEMFHSRIVPILQREKATHVFAGKSAWTVRGIENLDLESHPAVSPSIPALSKAYRGMGSATAYYDPDGTMRRIPLFWKFEDQVYPHAALWVALYSLGLDPAKSLRIDPARNLWIEGVSQDPEVGKVRIKLPMDAKGRVLLQWAGRFEEYRFPVINLGAVIDHANMIELRDWLLGQEADVKEARARLQQAREAARTRDPELALTLDELMNHAPAGNQEGERLPVQEWIDRLEADVEAKTAEALRLHRIRFHIRSAGRKLMGYLLKFDPTHEEEVRAVLARYREAPSLQGEEREAFEAKLEVDVDRLAWTMESLLSDMAAARPEANPLLPRARDALAAYQRTKASYDRLVGDLLDRETRLGERIAGRICLIGMASTGGTDFAPIPLQDRYPKVGLHANLYNGILTGQVFQTPDQALHHLVRLPHPALYNLILWITVALCVLFFLPHIGILNGALALVLGAMVYAGASTWILVSRSIWIDLVGPMLVGFFTYTGITVRRYYSEEKLKLIYRRSFETMVDPKIVEAVLENQEILSKLGGANYEVTAFFSDIEGFTTISELLSPEELAEMLVNYLTPMTDIIVLDHGGTRDKYIGDAIVAFWGAPLPVSDHASRGCLASLAQQAILLELKKEWEARGYVWYKTLREKGKDINFRIGLNTGVVKVGSFGSKNAVNYTMIGDAVNLASRLEGANKPYGTNIMIADATYMQAREAVEVRELDRIRVKGKLEPVTVFELLARRGHLDARKAEVVSIFHSGLRLYRDRDWSGAEAQFQAALALDPDDGPSQVYLERVRDTGALAELGPEWDGVYVMKTK